MFKIVCLFAVLSVALGSTVLIPSSDIPAQYAHTMPMRTMNNGEPALAPKKEDMVDASKVPSDDMDKAETFGFGYHKHFYVAPRYYGYYGGYYPYHGYHYGYPYYY